MTDGELPGRPATNLIHEGDDDAVYLPAARGTTGPSIRRAEPPKDYTTEIRFLAADFERSAGGYIQELTIEYPEASHAVQSLISSFKQYADDIARIAQMQNDLLQAIISRIPPQALSSVSIYLDDDEDSAARYEVERQVVRLIESANGVVVDADHAIRGSWFRRMRALFAESEAGRDALTLGAQAATSKIVNASNAQNTAALMQNLGPLLSSIEKYQSAVIRVQALLIVKLDGSLVVHQLTPGQQLALDLKPDLAKLPHEILLALDLSDKQPLSVAEAEKLPAGERRRTQY